VASKYFALISAYLIAILLLSSCTTQGGASRTSDGLKIVASTSLIGDVVRQVAGADAALDILIPAGADPHTFEPRPQDLVAISEADVVFINGLDLEAALEPTLQANIRGLQVAVSEGIEVLPFEHSAKPRDEEQSTEEDEHSAGDPHVWMDPNNIILWVDNIATTLMQLDPQNAEFFQQNAETYTAELISLDRWIREQVAQIPVGQRKLVSDHASFGYFAAEYGFTQVGLVVPSLSTNAAPSAQELAVLVDEIKTQNVKAIFVGTTVNPTLSQQVAADTGAQVVYVYTGSLSEPGSQADTYLKFMRYNITAIVNALK
jgi:ABC-type Zn uptake system ZnuABC Zn-binding protein ZnuA